MKPQILVTDRNPLIREELRRCLASREWEVLVAANALQCLELLQHHAPQILVLDPELPWGGGEGVLDWLSGQQPVQPLTIFLMNGHHWPSLRREWRSLVSARLERPTGLIDLLQFVDRLEREAWKWQTDHEVRSLTWNERQLPVDELAHREG